jgi:LmbE family N-acetylglucosaminyl deacetylase|tara:strand:- start:19988 stop:20674 length:687 start_codon:yes stop_codon:yes gene_type:complete
MNDSIVVIAAHPDDEILGCGGAIAKWANEGCNVNILLMTDGESSRLNLDEKNLKYRQDSRLTAADQCAKFLKCKSVTQLNFPDNRMSDHILLDVVQAVEKFIAEHKPSVVLTHHSGDVNIDHRVTHDAVLAACRPQPGHSVKTLLFFEIPSSSDWNTPASRINFSPNYFCDISKSLESKLDALKFYEEEMRPFPHSRSARAVESLARWRGCSVGVEAAEAFMVGRIIE